MCCLFGFYDYGGTLSAKQKNRIISALAISSEIRGTDATGIAYRTGTKLCIYKRPFPARWMRFRLPAEVKAVMGHTRMTTQGSEMQNCNNHPFYGVADGSAFALAHNGILSNDKLLRLEKKLPASRIETDSFAIVQLLEQAGTIDLDTLRITSELLRGSFTYTVLDDHEHLYIVRGNNPFCLYHFQAKGISVCIHKGDLKLRTVQHSEKSAWPGRRSCGSGRGHSVPAAGWRAQQRHLLRAASV